MSRRALGALVLGGLLCGCASSPKYACGVPDGVTCQPVSAVYAASTTSAPAGLRLQPPTDSEPALDDTTASLPVPDDAGDAPSAADEPGEPEQTEEPILTAPRVLRLWIAPWEDADGDLHDEATVYLRLDQGRWRLIR